MYMTTLDMVILMIQLAETRLKRCIGKPQSNIQIDVFIAVCSSNAASDYEEHWAHKAQATA